MKPAHFRVNGRDISASQNETLLEACARAGVLVDFSCEGGTCGACRVVIKGGFEKLPPRNEIETETASDRGFQPSERLACQTLAVVGIELVTPDFKE